MSRSVEQVRQVIKAYDVRGVVGGQLDAEFVRDVGASFARLMRAENASRVVIGHDMRESSPSLAEAFADGVVSQGLDVTHIGLSSTDQLYFASGSMDCPGAMFTASHNPAKYNGIKMCRAGAKPVGQDSGLGTISEELVAGVPAYDGEAGKVDSKDVLEDYGSFLRSLVPLDGIRPLKLVVDAGNGMGGHTVPSVLRDLADNIEPLYFELDGNFPNHDANPLDPKNIVDLQKAVREHNADIGLAFDGDADRCFVVDEKGEPVSPSAITALVAERALAEEPGATIIYNLITSHTVPELVQERGGVAVRTRVGHSFIKAQMAETGAVFGGEHSAHYYFREFWGADSGMLAAMHVLAALGKQDGPLSELMAKYSRYVASGEINSELDSAQAQQDKMEEVAETFAGRAVSIDRLDGVTVDLGEGAWFNIRASNTEPLLRLNAEAPTKARVDEMTDEVLAIIRG